MNIKSRKQKILSKIFPLHKCNSIDLLSERGPLEDHSSSEQSLWIGIQDSCTCRCERAIQCILHSFSSNSFLWTAYINRFPLKPLFLFVDNSENGCCLFPLSSLESFLRAAEEEQNGGIPVLWVRSISVH